MIPFAISLPSGGEWLVILVLFVMLFGVGKLPQVFQTLGKSLKSFRDAQKEGDDAVDVGSSPKELPSDADLTTEAQEVRKRSGNGS